MNELEKGYDPAKYEDSIGEAERDSGLYNPDNLPGSRKEAFTMMLPPPNATGILHMGHAVMLAVQDIVARFQRMRGKRVLWLPGTDHAAIATHSKVERILMKEEGKSRHDLGREVFVKRIDDFVEDSRATIRNQMRKMGSSLDWSREAFTLDDKRNFAVRNAFKRMYDDGLLYRADRVVNWDPKGQTVISDDEIVHEERTATLYTFKYSKDIPIPISTTRPETKVGDTAIAVHPEGKWKEYIGQEFDVIFAGATLHLIVIGDEEVEDAFGTGALGVTPAHSIIDFEMSKRHDLPLIQVINEDAHMMEASGDLVAGMSVHDARETVVQWLRENSLLQDEEDIEQNVGTAERTGEIIEPLPKLQWFIDVTKSFSFRQSKRAPIDGLKDGQSISVKEIMQHVVRSGQIEIIPNSFDKTYFHWIDNLRPWCISRQIWYGHRIPVWYCVACGKEAESPEDMEKCKDPIVSVEDLDKCPHCGGVVKQDPDTLDTWFSSGLWTFSTLGWPNEDASDLNTYHPTTLLETGRDILPFWVARMILMSTYLIGEIPFKYTYLHGLVRDGEGRKMSKSLDNSIDPLDMIDKYGTDATRLSLMIGLSPGNDTNLSEEKIAGFRNFTNKLWNIARFVFMSVDKVRVEDNPEPVTDADKWIVRRMNETIEQVTKFLDEPNFQFSQAGEALREFTWGDFADWYVEVAKVQLKDDKLCESTEAILLNTVMNVLKLWHPFMPFVTQRLWQEFGTETQLLVELWPEVEKAKGGETFELMKEIVVSVRNVRATYKISPAKKVNVILVSKKFDELKDLESSIKMLGRIEDLTFDKDASQSEGAVSVALGSVTVHVMVGEAVDKDQELERLTKELHDAEEYIGRISAKLENEAFVKNAPKDVVKQEKDNLDKASKRVATLKDQIDSLT
jgi:valyl-tRNA synthetase